MPDFDVEHLFKYHPPTPEQQVAYDNLTSAFKVAADAILAYCPDTAERTLAIRKLQETRMWANASVALNPMAKP